VFYTSQPQKACNGLKNRLSVRIFFVTLPAIFQNMDSVKKEGRYQRVITQLESLLTKTSDPVARMATIAAVLANKFEYFFWCGFYFVNGKKLIVGPYQGPLACQVLQDSGVCISAVERRESILVPDVHKFPGHIACDSRSNSEIVIPVWNLNMEIAAVLDIDSTTFDAFDAVDKTYLERIAAMVFNPID